MAGSSQATAGPGGKRFLALLALASSLSPFGMIVVVPTLGAVTSHYGVGHGAAQLLVAAYLFGLGLGQPLTGALSDRFGRRPVILTGFAIFTVASVACAFAHGFEALVALRFVQATGASVGTVVSRAIVRDTHDAIGAVEALAWIGAAMGVAPVVGPVIGGMTGAIAGPPGVFVACALVGAAAVAALHARLPETRVRAFASGDSSWLRNYRELLGSRDFVGYTLMYAFIQGCFFAFLAVGASVFADHLGLGQEQFGLTWGALGIVYIATAAAGARVARTFGVRRTLLGAGVMATLAGWSLAAAALAGTVTFATMVVSLAVLIGAAGIQTPLSVAGAVNCRPDIAGTASGLSSSLALVASGSFSIVAGTLYDGSFPPIAILIASSATLAAVTCFVPRRR